MLLIKAKDQCFVAAWGARPSRAWVSASRRNNLPSHFMKENLYNGLKPIPESKMSREARVASQAHRRATRKKCIELRQRGLPMIGWKDGKVREIPA